MSKRNPSLNLKVGDKTYNSQQSLYHIKKLKDSSENKVKYNFVAFLRF